MTVFHPSPVVYQPLVGSHLSFIAKISCKTGAMTKSGTEMPMTAIPMLR